MLGRNKTLQRVRQDLEMQFCRVQYLLSGEIVAFLTRNVYVRSVIASLSNVFIRTPGMKSLLIVGFQILKHV